MPTCAQIDQAVDGIRRSEKRTLEATVVVLILAAPALPQQGSSGADWRYMSGDAGGTKYSPLAQIDASNVSKLKIAWRWKSENYGPRPDYNLEVTPLAMNGKLFFSAGVQRAAVAIDGSTGPGGFDLSEWIQSVYICTI